MPWAQQCHGILPVKAGARVVVHFHIWSDTLLFDPSTPSKSGVKNADLWSSCKLPSAKSLSEASLMHPPQVRFSINQPNPSSEIPRDTPSVLLAVCSLMCSSMSTTMWMAFSQSKWRSHTHMIALINGGNCLCKMSKFQESMLPPLLWPSQWWRFFCHNPEKSCMKGASAPFRILSHNKYTRQ